jgi:hypothetical protein
MRKHVAEPLNDCKKTIQYYYNSSNHIEKDSYTTYELINKGGQTILETSDGLAIAVVQTKPKAPEPIRTPKLSGFRHS